MNDNEKIIFLAIASIIASVIISIAGLLNLDFWTAVQVFGWLIIFALTLFAVIKSGFFSVKFIPIFIVWFLACFRPAYNFWAYGPKSSSLYAVKIYREIPWYANDWGQLGIAVAILIFGHVLILKINDEI